MKILALVLLILACSCNQPNPAFNPAQSQIDSLQRKLSESYKPGLGEFMMGIQVHHAKLWFAGKAANWSLADFETKEIRESVEDIQTYCQDRKEAASIPMINPPLDSLDKAILDKNVSKFRSGFIFLTNTCNNCHQVTKHEFNVIQIPDSPPYSNQVYTPGSGEKDHINK